MAETTDVRLVDVGEEAPDFSLHATRGAVVNLGSLRWTKRALLIFYPRALTGG